MRWVAVAHDAADPPARPAAEPAGCPACLLHATRTARRRRAPERAPAPRQRLWPKLALTHREHEVARPPRARLLSLVTCLCPGRLGRRPCACPRRRSGCGSWGPNWPDASRRTRCNDGRRRTLPRGCTCPRCRQSRGQSLGDRPWPALLAELAAGRHPGELLGRRRREQRRSGGPSSSAAPPAASALWLLLPWPAPARPRANRRRG